MRKGAGMYSLEPCTKTGGQSRIDPSAAGLEGAGAPGYWATFGRSTTRDRSESVHVSGTDAGLKHSLSSQA